MTDKKIRKKIIDIIKKNKTFLITAHMNLEGDALGSELAFYRLLKKLNKKVTVYNHDSTPDIYKFLPGTKNIRNKPPAGKYDVIFVLDCSDSSRAGKVEKELAKGGVVVNIDHHTSNTYFGAINWVRPEASSASELIYYLCKQLRIIDKNIALCLYTGIFTDTGSFTYANTRSDTHKIIYQLMQFNIKPNFIYENIHSLCFPDDIKFIGKYISKLKFASNKRICWIIIHRWQKKDYDLTEVLFSVMRLLREPEVFVLFKKIGRKKIRVNFRSRLRVDVNRIARFFGGGGHKRASGTTLIKDFREAEREVIAYIKKSLNGKKHKK